MEFSIIPMFLLNNNNVTELYNLGMVVDVLSYQDMKRAKQHRWGNPKKNRLRSLVPLLFKLQQCRWRSPIVMAGVRTHFQGTHSTTTTARRVGGTRMCMLTGGLSSFIDETWSCCCQRTGRMKWKRHKLYTNKSADGRINLVFNNMYIWTLLCSDDNILNYRTVLSPARPHAFRVLWMESRR